MAIRWDGSDHKRAFCTAYFAQVDGSLRCKRLERGHGGLVGEDGEQAQLVHQIEVEVVDRSGAPPDQACG